MTVGVKEPGRWMLAMASRSTVEPARGRRRAIAMVSIASSRSMRKTPIAEATKIRGNAMVVSCRHREGGEDRGDQRRGDDVAPARPVPLGGDLIAKQHRHRNVVGAAERPQRERQSGQESIHDRQRQRPRMQRGRYRQRNDGAERPGNRVGQRGAKRGADQGGQQRDQHHLPAIDREYRAAGSAERLHGADGVALARQMRGDRVSDADAADQQRGQSDQREKLREALDIAFELRRRLAAGADFPAGVRERGLGRCLDRRHRAIAAVGRRQPQPVLPAHQAAGLQQPGGAQRGLADEETRPEAKAAGKLVRFAGQRGAQFDRDIADGDAVAGFQIEPCQQRWIDRGAERAVLLRE